MGGNNSQINRFPLPDNWTVEDFICMTVAIPNDPQYIAMMRGLLETLTWQRSFKLHPTDMAAYEVSKTWAAAFASRQLTFGDCDMPEFRLDPETCLLELNCSDDPDDPDWQPLPSPGYDPSQDEPIPNPPYPDPPPEGESNQCLAAANTAAMLENGAINFANLLDTNALLGAIVAVLYTFLSSVVTVTLSQLWLGLGVAYGAFDPVTIIADLAAFEWTDVKCLLLDYYNEDGTMSGVDWASVLDSMQDKVTETGNQIWLFVAMVWGLMGSVGATYSTRWANILSDDCTDCACVETTVYDFTDNDGGWETIDLDYYSGPSGHWETGIGWIGNVHYSGSGYALNIAIIDLIPTGRTVVAIRATYVVTYDGAPTTFYLTTYPGFVTLIDDTGTWLETRTPSWAGSEDTRSLSVFFHQYGYQDSVILTRVEVDIDCEG